MASASAHLYLCAQHQKVVNTEPANSLLDSVCAHCRRSPLPNIAASKKDLMNAQMTSIARLRTCRPHKLHITVQTV